MSECCATQKATRQYPRKHRCPVNGEEYSAVRIKTLLHHIQAPWSIPLNKQGYYFCTDPACKVVYFGQDDTVINLSALKTRVGQKETQQDRPICYCFDVTQQQAQLDSSIKKFVVQKTKAAQCACEIRNPSGKCCLKDFPD